MEFLFTIIGLAVSLFIIYYFLNSDDSYEYESPFPNKVVLALFVTAFLASSLYIHGKLSFSIVTYALNTVFLSLCFVVSYIDFYTKYIYDAILLVYGIAILGLNFILGFDVLKQSLLSAVIGLVFYGLIYILARLYYKKEAFGQGDILLMGVIALMFRPIIAIIACFLSFYVAAIFLLILKFSGKGIERTQEIAFGPYICISAVLLMAFGDKIITLFIR